MLVGSGLEENLIAFLSLEPCNAVRQHDFIVVSDMRLARCVGDRRSQIIGSLVLHSYFLSFLTWHESKKPASLYAYAYKKTSRMPVLPLLFICLSQDRPPRVNNPVRYNRRNLSQSYPAGSVRCSEAMFHLPKPRFSQPVRSSAEAFSVKHSVNLLSSSLPFKLFFSLT